MRKRAIATYLFMAVVVHWGYKVIDHWIATDKTGQYAHLILGVILGVGTTSLVSLLVTIWKENVGLSEKKG